MCPNLVLSLGSASRSLRLEAEQLQSPSPLLPVGSARIEVSGSDALLSQVIELKVGSSGSRQSINVAVLLVAIPRCASSRWG